jgi:hypothetical protein
MCRNIGSHERNPVTGKEAEDDQQFPVASERYQGCALRVGNGNLFVAHERLDARRRPGYVRA